jgi:hypothetical protein
MHLHRRFRQRRSLSDMEIPLTVVDRYHGIDQIQFLSLQSTRVRSIQTHLGKVQRILSHEARKIAIIIDAEAANRS